MASLPLPLLHCPPPRRGQVGVGIGLQEGLEIIKAEYNRMSLNFCKSTLAAPWRELFTAPLPHGRCKCPNHNTHGLHWHAGPGAGPRRPKARRGLRNARYLTYLRICRLVKTTDLSRGARSFVPCRDSTAPAGPPEKNPPPAPPPVESSSNNIEPPQSKTAGAIRAMLKRRLGSLRRVRAAAQEEAANSAAVRSSSMNYPYPLKAAHLSMADIPPSPSHCRLSPTVKTARLPGPQPPAPSKRHHPLFKMNLRPFLHPPSNPALSIPLLPHLLPHRPLVPLVASPQLLRVDPALCTIPGRRRASVRWTRSTAWPTAGALWRRMPAPGGLIARPETPQRRRRIGREKPPRRRRAEVRRGPVGRRMRQGRGVGMWWGTWVRRPWHMPGDSFLRRRLHRSSQGGYPKGGREESQWGGAWVGG